MKKLMSSTILLLACLPALATQVVTTGNSDTATIWFYRTDSAKEPVRIYAGTRELATVAKGEFFGVTVLAGKHYFSWTPTPKEKETVWALISAGKEVYFRVEKKKISPAALDKALKDIQKLKPISPENRVDGAVRTLNRRANNC